VTGSLVLHAARTPLEIVMIATGLVLLLCRVPPLISVVIAIAAGLITSR
jgi:hypothetical protein